MFSRAICVVNTFLSSPKTECVLQLFFVVLSRRKNTHQKFKKEKFMVVCEEDLTQHRSSLNGFEAEFPSVDWIFFSPRISISSRDLTLQQLFMLRSKTQKHFCEITRCTDGKSKHFCLPSFTIENIERFQFHVLQRRLCNDFLCRTLVV